MFFYFGPLTLLSIRPHAHAQWEILKFTGRQNGPFSSCPKFLFQSEVKCEAIAMKMFIYCHANKPHFHKKGFGLNLVLEVRVLQTEK